MFLSVAISWILFCFKFEPFLVKNILIVINVLILKDFNTKLPIMKKYLFYVNAIAKMELHELSRF